MLTTLPTLLEQIRALLMDGGSAIWDDTTLTAAVRQAAGEYSLASGSPISVAGLDGALESTLAWPYDALVVWGGAAYAALARAVDRAESFQVAGEAEALGAWGAARLAEFKEMLRSVFPAYRPGETSPREPARLSELHGSQAAPWSAWPEPADDPYPNGYERR